MVRRQVGEQQKGPAGLSCRAFENRIAVQV